jgi:predicted nuclease of predicted toxin-antitoxin system
VTVRLLLDQHLNARALPALRAQGVDVVHAAEVGLASADDPALLRWAQREGRIVVTRNYRDFAPLVKVLLAKRDAFPGVLFIATSVRHSDVRAHVRGLSEWLRIAEREGWTAVPGGYAWVR